MNQYIQNILETHRFKEKLVSEWRGAYHPDDWAYIRGMLSTLHLLEDDQEAEEDLLLLYAIAGQHFDEARAKYRGTQP